MTPFYIGLIIGILIGSALIIWVIWILTRRKYEKHNSL
jgi:hypothetical protein